MFSGLYVSIFQSTVDEPGLEDIETQAEICRIAVEEGRWHDATNAYRQTQYAVNRRSNYVDFYNILKFRTFGNADDDRTSGRGHFDMEGTIVFHYLMEDHK